MQKTSNLKNEEKAILVVDDDIIIRNSLKELLQDEGYKVFTASNGEEGLEQIWSQKPDLVVLDAIMPIMDGKEFSERLKSDLNISDVPVLAFSALQKLPPGMKVSGFIKKPIEIDTFLKTVKHFLSIQFAS